MLRRKVSLTARLSTLAALAALWLPAQAASPTEVVAAFHSALASGDSAKAASLLSPAVLIFESGFVERSRDEYAGHHLVGDIEFAKTTNAHVLRSSERISGNLSVVIQETETRGTYRGREIHLLGTETAVLEKTGDGWAIVHVHWSSRKG